MVRGPWRRWTGVANKRRLSSVQLNSEYVCSNTLIFLPHLLPLNFWTPMAFSSKTSSKNFFGMAKWISVNNSKSLLVSYPFSYLNLSISPYLWDKALIPQLNFIKSGWKLSFTYILAEVILLISPVYSAHSWYIPDTYLCPPYFFCLMIFSLWKILQTSSNPTSSIKV